MTKITQEELNQILEDHRRWMYGEGGNRADLSDVDLSWMDLSGKVLRRAKLSHAKLIGTNLTDTDLTSAYLTDADLSNANLSWTTLSFSYLDGANLQGVRIMNTTGNGKQVRTMQLNKYYVVVAGDELAIGCEQHKVNEWAAFTDSEIELMDVGAVEWWKKHKELVLAFAKQR